MKNYLIEIILLILISCSDDKKRLLSTENYNEIVHVILTDSLFHNNNYVLSSTSRSNYIRYYIQVDSFQTMAEYYESFDWLHIQNDLDAVIKDKMTTYFKAVKNKGIIGIKRTPGYSIYHSDLYDVNGLRIDFIELKSETLAIDSLYIWDKVSDFQIVNDKLYKYSSKVE